MSLAPLDVLNRHYPRLLWSGAPQPLGNRGGFSGARLWRLDGPAGPLCLRAWPPAMSPSRLDFIHQCMARARAAGLPFVPRLFPTADGRTWLNQAGRLWELQEWLPGEADYHARPSPAKLAAACGALARLHACWAALPGERGPCPAVRRRLDAVREWRALVASGWRPPPHDPAAERAWRVLPGWVERTPVLLQPFVASKWDLQPCLCDVWHDHVLFEGDRVTGLVDYGAVKIDHPAVDLSRLLGSLAGDDAAEWAAGLTAYRAVRPLTADEEALAWALDLTGTVVGAATWVRWLYHEGRAFEDREAAGRRLADLTARIEFFSFVGR